MKEMKVSRTYNTDEPDISPSYRPKVGDILLRVGSYKNANPLMIVYDFNLVSLTRPNYTWGGEGNRDSVEEQLREGLLIPAPVGTKIVIEVIE